MTNEIQDQIDKAEEIRQRNIGTKKETQTHPGAIYTSRLLTNVTNGMKFYSRVVRQLSQSNLFSSF